MIELKTHALAFLYQRFMSVASLIHELYEPSRPSGLNCFNRKSEKIDVETNINWLKVDSGLPET